MSVDRQMRAVTRLHQRATDDRGTTAVTREELVEMATVPADETDPEFVDTGWRIGQAVPAGIASPAWSESGAWPKEGQQAVCIFHGGQQGASRHGSVLVSLDCEAPGRECLCGLYYVPELAGLLQAPELT